MMTFENLAQRMSKEEAQHLLDHYLSIKANIGPEVWKEEFWQKFEEDIQTLTERMKLP